MQQCGSYVFLPWQEALQQSPMLQALKREWGECACHCSKWREKKEERGEKKKCCKSCWGPQKREERAKKKSFFPLIGAAASPSSAWESRHELTPPLAYPGKKHPKQLFISAVFFFYVGVNFVKVWINKLQWWQIMVILHISGKLVHWKVLIFVGVQKWLPKSKSAFKTSGFHFLMIKLQYQKQTQKKINYNEWWMDTDPFTQGKKFSNKSQREEVVILTLRQTVQRPTST